MKYRAPGISEREAAVLGLLYERPLYGYTIEKIIEERGMRHWTEIGFSSIYYVLKRLEQRHLITSSSEQEGTSPSRNVYTLTSSGREGLKDAVRLFLSRSMTMISPFDLGIANAAVLSHEEIISCLTERLQMIDEMILHITSMRETKIAECRPFYVIALFDRSLVHLRAEQQWVAGFMKQMLERKGNEGVTMDRKPETKKPVERRRRK
jgi:DNA-binding PadR family transcriptional regulator